MISPEVARAFVGVLGNMLTLFLLLSPMPTFIQIWKKGSVDQFSATPYLASLINCMLWVLYGLPMVHPHTILLVITNGLGIIIQLFYVLLFIYYSTGKTRMKLVAILLVEITFVAVVALLVLTLVHTYDRRSMIVGSICLPFGTLTYAAPMTVLGMVIRTRSVEYMPFFLSFATFVSATCWAAYALIRFDIYVVIPNGLGALLGLAQLVLYAAFYKSTQRQIEERKLKIKEAALAEVVVVEDPQKIADAPQQ